MEAQADPIRTHEFEALSDEVQRLSSILSSLLHLAAVDQVQPALQEIDIGALIRCRLQSWRPQATARQVVISRDTDTAPDQPVIVLTDPTLFGSALDAVLDNGIKFSPPQGTVTVRIHPETDVVRCVVSDDGAGLLPGEFDRIGGRFWRSMRHQNVDGTGLGLAIVRTLQEAVGGEVSFAPNTPSGLSVTLTLPLAGAWKPGPAAEPRTRGAGACLERIVARPDHRNEGVLR
jgi:signal transduction histidine kinase